MKNGRDDELGFDLPAPVRVGRGRLLALGLLGVAVIGAAFVVGYLPRRRDRAALAAEATGAEAAKPRVEVVLPKSASSDRAIMLPGSVQALEQTVIYPRASGYVHSWSADIGDKVKQGALLCEIDTPEVDEQLAQAKAQLAQADAGLVQAQANAAFSKVNAARYEGLTPAGLASQQDLEKQRAQAAVDAANVKVAEANVQAQKANVAHLAQLRSFARITAPFSGTIVARTAERGALVTAGNQTPLFTLASTETLRVFVQVPQDVAPGVRVDQPARVSFREYAGRTFEGKIAHAALALDAQTRTMTTEVRVPNPSGELLAGMYAQVAFTLPTPHRVFEVPASALMSDGTGVRVATVKADDMIRIVPVAIERDTGATIEIASGLVGDERIVRLASVKLVDGLAVDVKK